jgi:hypothetical protein
VPPSSIGSLPVVSGEANSLSYLKTTSSDIIQNTRQRRIYRYGELWRPTDLPAGKPSDPSSDGPWQPGRSFCVSIFTRSRGPMKTKTTTIGWGGKYYRTSALAYWDTWPRLHVMRSPWAQAEVNLSHPIMNLILLLL